MKRSPVLVLVALLAACSDAPSFRSRIESHDVHVAVHPSEGRLVVGDRLVVRSGRDGISSVALLVSDGMTVDSVGSEDREVRFRRGPGLLHVEIDPPLARGETVTLDYAAHADGFLVRETSGLIEEVAINGQLRAESSFSSHVYYYPADARNDASVNLGITVPAPYAAVSGGETPGLYWIEKDWRTYLFDAPRRPRLLPFGFAVARYRSESRTTPGGLSVELHCLPGFERRMEGKLDVAARAATFFEEILGPLPWGRVAVCQVAPVEKEAGCSIPGQILYSERLAAVDGGALLVDEMSHQWNAYLAPLPNELAEGFATYSVALFREREDGAAHYAREIASYRRMYFNAVLAGGDRAVSDPGVYSTPAYRGIAFAKTAVGLHGLRVRLGDERFFAGLRRVFETVREPETAYEDVRRAFEWAAGEDLRAFFDGWLHRPGVPEIALSWEPARVEAGPGVELTLEQTQDGAPFEIDLDLAVRTADDGVVTRRAALRERRRTYRFPLPSGPKGVGLQPDGTGLFRPARR